MSVTDVPSPEDSEHTHVTPDIPSGLSCCQRILLMHIVGLGMGQSILTIWMNMKIFLSMRSTLFCFLSKLLWGKRIGSRFVRFTLLNNATIFSDSTVSEYFSIIFQVCGLRQLTIMPLNISVDFLLEIDSSE